MSAARVQECGRPRPQRGLRTWASALLWFVATTVSSVDANWWSYQPIVRPALPTVKNAAWPHNNLDRFILAKLEEKNLQPSPEAAPRTLIRRLYFDLLGLPPTPEEVETFVRECSPIGNRQSAVGNLVDRLLASPHYGERWARHWLDIAHYADTHGFERDQLRPNAWRYRDYVIGARNADKPYDQFLREQIAGDAIVEVRKGDTLFPHQGTSVSPLEPADKSVRATELTATLGFLAAGPWDFVGQVETKSDVLKRALICAQAMA